MKHIRILGAMALALAIGAGTAMAGNGGPIVLAKSEKKKTNAKWEALHDDIKVTKESDRADIPVGKTISAVRITCMDGSVIINTVWVKQAGKKNRNTVGRRLEKGDSEEIKTDASKPVDALAIGHDGRGTYRVEIQTTSGDRH